MFKKAKKVVENKSEEPPKEKSKKVLRKRNENKPFYVNNKEMFEELRKFNETGIITEELGGMFIKIAKRYSNMYKFSSYTYREELVNSAVARMVEYVSKFSMDRPNPNPFAYFTQITHNQFITIIKKETQQFNTKMTLRDLMVEELSDDEKMKYMKDGYDIGEFVSSEEQPIQ